MKPSVSPRNFIIAYMLKKKIHFLGLFEILASPIDIVIYYYIIYIWRKLYANSTWVYKPF